MTVYILLATASYLYGDSTHTYVVGVYKKPMDAWEAATRHIVETMPMSEVYASKNALKAIITDGGEWRSLLCEIQECEMEEGDKYEGIHSIQNGTV